MDMNVVDYVAWVLLVVGGLNWGLVGAVKYNVVDTLFGVDSMIARGVYVLVGLAAVYAVVAMAMKMSKGSTS